ISPTTGLITTEAGGTDSFTVVLDSQPSNDVFVNFISEDPTEGTVSPLLTFSTINWDQPQTVLITGTDDADDDGDTAYIINTSVTSTDNRYDALLLDTLSVTNLDDDEPIPDTGGPTPPPPVTTLSSQGERLVVGGMGDVPIELSISQLSSDQVREIIIFETDSTGAVNGLTTNDAGYLDAVLNTAQVVFSTLEAGDIDELNPQRTITVAAGSILQFAVISDGSLDSVRRGAGGTVNLTGVSSQADIVKLQTLNGGSVQAGFDINQTGEFSQLVINAVAANESVPIGAELQGLNTDSELFDLRAQTGLLTATIDVYREASLDNVVGLFVVENEQGQVRDDMGVLLSPGDDGYGQAALAQRININLVGTNDETVRYTTQILGGQLLSTFLVVDGTVGELLDMDTTNDPSIYFTHTLGNSDGADHVRLLGNNTFGFEDLPGGGDADFDDVVIRATFA
nr:DUF4114 domain-containing protein [Leptolyngbyaceae cyanobacterium MAG.088]